MAYSMDVLGWLEEAFMKATLLICCILALALLGLSCAPEGTLEISVT